MQKVNADGKSRPIMSRAISSYGEQVSKEGYLNTEEFMKTLAKSFGQSTLAGVGFFVALTVLGDFENWYIGPYKGELAMFVTLLVGFVRAKSLGAKYMAEGDPIDES
jgi:hypothetical protein